MKHFFIILWLSITLCTTAFGQTISVPSNQYKIDPSKSLAVCNLEVGYINTMWTGPKTAISFDVNYVFNNPVTTVSIGTPYTITHPITLQQFTLYFTQLPLVFISTENTILDEPKVLANFRLVESNQTEVVSKIGIEYRGAYSQSLSKKSFRIEFWEDMEGNTTQDVSLLGMRMDDDWNLQAMFNEPLRIRSVTNNTLWNLMHTPYYNDLEPNAKSGIMMKYAEVFVNDEYRGVYGVGEPVDRSLLKLKKYNNNIRGELYKGITWDGAETFSYLPPYDNNSRFWSGFEMDYPTEITEWNNLYNFIDFVINENDTNFYSQYASQFDVDNAVDYYILLNLLRATDNTGKNIYIAKYNTNEPYFYVPWDLDGTFGTNWYGGQDGLVDDLLSNGFYNRLWNDCSNNGFRDRLQNRWNELRNDLLAETNLQNMFLTNYNLLVDNGVYAREELAWEEFVLETDQLNYLNDWINNRLSFLDTKFNESCNSLAIQTINQPAFNIYPIPATTTLNIDLESSGNNIFNLYSQVGQLVFSKAITASQNNFILPVLANGIYYGKISGEQQLSFKLIIKH